MINASFWKDRRVAITGHTGFKGAWLALWLTELGAKVSGFSLAEPPSNPFLFNQLKLNSKVASTAGDIRDEKSLGVFFDQNQPEVVLHLAAQSLVRRSYLEPLETFDTNVIGTVNLLQALRLSKSVKSIVVVTSDKCYENTSSLWGYRESDPLGGRDPYSASKACAELVTRAYRDSFYSGNAADGSSGALLGSVRAGNVIGGGDWAEDRIVPDLIRAFSTSSVGKIRNPNAIRPWQYVLEPLCGYLMVAEQLWQGNREIAEAWNFGPSEVCVTSVAELAKLVQQFWGSKTEVELGAGASAGSPSKPLHEATLLTLDSTKARTKLKWFSKLNFSETIERTIGCYKAIISAKDSSEVLRACIKELEYYSV